MRIVKTLLVLFALALVVAGVFAWMLPADVGYRYGARLLGPVTLTGVRGTVWNGHADGVSAFGRDLGELDWHAQKLPLLGGQWIAEVRIQGADVDLAATQAVAQDFQHLLQLEFARSRLGNDEFVQLELGVRALEIEAIGQLAIGLVDRIGQFVLVHFGDDVERRHGRVP